MVAGEHQLKAAGKLADALQQSQGLGGQRYEVNVAGHFGASR